MDYIPVISIQAILKDAGRSWPTTERPAASECNEIASMIGDACRDVGFFYIRDHGVDEELVNALFRDSQRFFAQPKEEKEKIRMENSGLHWKGWFELGGELTAGKIDHKEGIYFGDELPPDHAAVVARRPMHGPNLFPSAEAFPQFKRNVLAYLDAMERVSFALLRAIAVSLRLPANHFDGIFKPTPTRLLRVFQYPAPTDADASTRWGVGEHCDYGVLTILRQDAVGGLEVKGRGGVGWMAAPPIPGTFVVNIGDMLERLTWGRYRATPHRVKNTHGVDRMSIPFFFDPCWDAVVEPIAELAPDDDAPPHTREGGAQERWDGQDVVLSGARTYGDILTARVSKVFPQLIRGVNVETDAS
eukprot:m.8422 g.8422  ORF g.8422 m.8422 type:complete len:360 (+) comp6354_c0_seq2:419-1498(+)